MSFWQSVLFLAVASGVLGVFFVLPWMVVNRAAGDRWRSSSRRWKQQTVLRSLTTLCLLAMGASKGIADSSPIPQLGIVATAAILAFVFTVLDWTILRSENKLPDLKHKMFGFKGAYLVYMVWMNIVFAAFLASAPSVWLKNNEHESDWAVAIVMVLVLFGLREAWQKVALPSADRGI